MINALKNLTPLVNSPVVSIWTVSPLTASDTAVHAMPARVLLTTLDAHVPTKINANLDPISAIGPTALVLTISDHTNACATQDTDFHSNSKVAEMEMPTQMDPVLTLMNVLNNPTIAMLQMHKHCWIIPLSL